MKKSVIWSAVLVSYILFIYSNSIRTAEVSSAQSGYVLVLAERFLANAGLGEVGLTEYLIRKAAHFSEYAVMGILLSACVRSYRLPQGLSFCVTAIMGFAVPFVDETIQLFAAGRSGQISDVWLDGLGVAFGVLVICLGRRFFGKRKEKKLREKL